MRTAIRLRNSLLKLSILCLIFASTSVHAGFMSTSDALALEQAAPLLSDIRVKLADEQIRTHLAQYGVSMADVEARLATMSPAELVRFSEQLDQAPAGAGVVEVVGVVFIVLLILELVGVTDIFNAF